MVVIALIGAGVDAKFLQEARDSLNVPGASPQATTTALVIKMTQVGLGAGVVGAGLAFLDDMTGKCALAASAALAFVGGLVAWMLL